MNCWLPLRQKVQIINGNIIVAKGSPVVLQQPTSVKHNTSRDWDLVFTGENIKAGEKKEWLLLEQNKPASTND